MNRPDTPGPFAGASIAALGLAAARSVESSRQDRLIDDPFARTLFEAAGDRLAMRHEWPRADDEVTATEALHLHGSRYIGLRTRFYDDRIVAAAATGIRQVVLLGAGLDTRALRLSLPADLVFYEVDHASVLEFKKRHLADAGQRPRCAVTQVGTDLSTDALAVLEHSGFDSRLPTAWIAEGLLPYLEPTAQQSVLDHVDRLSALGSSLAFDHIAGGDVAGLSARSGIDMQGLLKTTDATDEPGGHLATRDWTVRTCSADEIAERYGRDLADPFARSSDTGHSPPPWLKTVFTAAHKGSDRSEQVLREHPVV